MKALFARTPSNSFLKTLIVILLIPALFINLGLMPFILDEATRALVALEMIFSNNYIVPTINGEFYYNKPPLFNWILIGAVKLTGNYSEFAFRLPVVLSLIGFAVTVYFTLKNELGREVAFLTAIALITCGRIFFYDSFKGLIDITFSWITYSAFWSVYYFNKQGKLFWLFFVSWLFTSLGFLMKGLPSIIFQGITLLVFFIYTKQFRSLFSWKHLAGGLIFVLLVGGYFLWYSQYNSLDNYWDALWSESAKRTVIEESLISSLAHLFTFPLEFLYHFLPWTLLLLFLIGKGRLKQLFSLPPARFIILIFLSNILVYWFSPAIYPRYLFMFLPLAFGIGAYSYYQFGRDSGLDRYFWQPLMIVFSLAFALVLSALPLIGKEGHFIEMQAVWIILLILSWVLAVGIIKYKSQRIYIFILVLILSRISFNFFVLPDRIISGNVNMLKDKAVEAAKVTENEKVFLYKDCLIHHPSSFYFTAEKEEILSRWYDAPQSRIFYIMPLQDAKEMENVEVVRIFESGRSKFELAVIKFYE